jgi:putative ABC transport system ATP-binding protein
VTDLVVCQHVGRTYGRGRTAVVAVHDVSCAVGPYTRVALVGPSGSGKSTLLHLLAGIERVTSGDVSWPGWSDGPFGDPTRVGVVFQGPSLIAAMSAVENAAFPLLARGLPHKEASGRAREALDLLGLSALADQTPDELSSGQAQRVAVARVLATRPALVLADEPTGRLDHAMGARVVEELFHAADHVGAGLVVATHDPVIARQLTETWTMRDGELEVAA